jgi:hypothetical protein
MKLERLIAQVESLRNEAANALNRATDSSIQWNAGTRLQELTQLKLLLLMDEVEALKKELTKTRLERRYRRGA